MRAVLASDNALCCLPFAFFTNSSAPLHFFAASSAFAIASSALACNLSASSRACLAAFCKSSVSGCFSSIAFRNAIASLPYNREASALADTFDATDSAPEISPRFLSLSE